jgi:hypothetical protein
MVLNAMAAAGGMGRGCPADGGTSLCDPSESCDPTTHLCSKAYYQASNRAELTQVLTQIGGRILGNPCLFVLAATPSDPRLLSVLINGTAVASGSNTWAYDAPTNTVSLVGDLCSQAQASTSATKLTVEIRILQGL